MAGIGGLRRAIPEVSLLCPGEIAENRRLSCEVVPGGLQLPGDAEHEERMRFESGRAPLAALAQEESVALSQICVWLRQGSFARRDVALSGNFFAGKRRPVCWGASTQTRSQEFFPVKDVMQTPFTGKDWASSFPFYRSCSLRRTLFFCGQSWRNFSLKRAVRFKPYGLSL